MSNDPKPRRGEDPGPGGPESEQVGDDQDSIPTRRGEDSRRAPDHLGAGMPMIPEHGAPDANPIDPRVM